MCEQTALRALRGGSAPMNRVSSQGYLAHEKVPSPLGPPLDPRYSPTAGSQEGGVSYARSTPVNGAHVVNGLRSHDTPITFVVIIHQPHS